MQYTYIHRLYKATNHKGWSLFIKAFIFLVTGIFLFKILSVQALPMAIDVANSILNHNGNSLLVYITIILLPFNWLLEAMKWHSLVKKTESTTIISSYKGILTGVTLSFLTPHGIGDYFGRILQLNGKKRIQCIGYALLTSFTQLQATLFFGGIAFLYLLFLQNTNSFLIFITAFFIGLSNFLLMLFLFFNKKVIKEIRKYRVTRLLYYYLFLIGKINIREMFKIIFYSFIRYGIFTLQFLLLFKYYNIPGSILHLLMGISFIFLVKSIFPTFFELGVREAAAVYFFSEVASSQLIISASISLWLINIVVPALFGFFLLPKVKIFVS